MSFEQFIKEKFNDEYSQWRKNFISVCIECNHKMISHTIWREESYDNRAGGYLFGYRCKEESCSCKTYGELKTKDIQKR